MWGRWTWRILDGLVDERLLMVVIDGMGCVSGGLSIRPHDTLTLTLAESSTHVTLRLWGTSTCSLADENIPGANRPIRLSTHYLLPL